MVSIVLFSSMFYFWLLVWWLALKVPVSPHSSAHSSELEAPGQHVMQQVEKAWGTLHQSLLRNILRNLTK